MAKSEKQVADPKSADIVPMESLFEADAGRGNENISQDDLATPFLKILSGNDPILDVAETPDGCTTAEPSIVADPSDEEKEIPLTPTSEPRPVVKTNSPHAPKS